MKKVEAILTPYKLDAIKEMLKQHGCQEIVVSAVTGSGGGDGHLLYYQDAKYTPDLPRVRLEAVVLDTEAMPTVQDILRLSNGHTTADANVSADLLEQVVSIGISKLEPISTRLKSDMQATCG